MSQVRQINQKLSCVCAFLLAVLRVRRLENNNKRDEKRKKKKVLGATLCEFFYSEEGKRGQEEWFRHAYASTTLGLRHCYRVLCYNISAQRANCLC